MNNLFDESMFLLIRLNYLIRCLRRIQSLVNGFSINKSMEYDWLSLQETGEAFLISFPINFHIVRCWFRIPCARVDSLHQFYPFFIYSYFGFYRAEPQLEIDDVLFLFLLAERKLRMYGYRVHRATFMFSRHVIGSRLRKRWSPVCVCLSVCLYILKFKFETALKSCKRFIHLSPSKKIMTSNQIFD
mgnify:CR=1 FL=1